jgi:hypothetical protein
MRILSLGVPLPNPQVDNYSFASAPTFFDYDAVVVDPVVLSQLIEDVVDQTGEHATAEQQLVVNGATNPLATGLADLLRRRQTETARLLARGGLIICLDRPDVYHHRVAGFTGCDRYFWLPAPAGLQYREPHLQTGYGTDVLVTDSDHPFAAYVQSLRQRLAYSAYFNDGIAGFSSFGKIFARSAGGAAVGVELTVDAGSVVFLPYVRDMTSSAQRQGVASALVDCVRRFLGKAVEGAPPPWVAQQMLPGLAERQSNLDDALVVADEAQSKLDEAKARLEELDRYHRMLWQEGKLGLEQPVREALKALGYKATESIDEPCALYNGTERILLEVEGSPAAVGMEPHYRLRRRIEDEIAASGKPQKGVVVVNGYRLTAPQTRETQYVDALRVAAESMRYCLLTTHQLFEALRRHQEGDATIADVFWQRLFTCEGLLDLEGLLGNTE